MADSEHQSRTGASPDATLFLSVWDELVRDAALAESLDRIHRDFHLINRSTFFWYDMTMPGQRSPANPIEELAELVVRTVRPQKLAGVEYWSNTLGEGVGVAVKRGDTKMRKIIDYGLERVRQSGRYEELLLRYFPVRLL